MVKALLEGLLFAAGEAGVTKEELSAITKEGCSKIASLLKDLEQDFKVSRRGIQLKLFHNKYLLTTLPEHHSYITKLPHIRDSSLLSRAALETLAIIAYKQPLSKEKLEQLRGIRSSRTLKTLAEKKLIMATDSEQGPVYHTTDTFLNYLGLSSLNDLKETALPLVKE
ncbi:MAG: hypothetical protein RLZ12_107 [Bacillota bacterium]